MNSKNFQDLCRIVKQQRRPNQLGSHIPIPKQTLDFKGPNDDSLEQSSEQVEFSGQEYPASSDRDVPVPKFKDPLKNHFRSQSCPFERSQQSNKKLHHHRSPSTIREEESLEQPAFEQSEADSLALQSKKLARISQRGLPFSKKKSCQSIKSVVIHNSDTQNIYMSSMLYSEKKITEEDQRRPTIKKTSKRNVERMMEDKFPLSKNRFLKTKLEQQIKRKQLSQDLEKVEKEAADIAVKQQVLELIMNRSSNNGDSSVVYY